MTSGLRICHGRGPDLGSRAMVRTALSAFAVFASALPALGGCAFDAGTAAAHEEPAPLEATGLGALELPAAGEEDGPAVVRTRRPAGESDGGDSDVRIGLRWRVDPPLLQVYRSTAVTLSLEEAPREHPTASCTWSFGDGSPLESGCTVTHTFHGGQADQVVTLTLEDGSWSWTSTRTIPLERLEVVDGLLDVPVPEALDGLPAKPEAGDTSFRFAVVAESAAEGGVPEDVATAVRRLGDTVRPDLVVHAGGLVVAGAGDAGWDRVRDTFAPLAEADVPVAFALSAADRAEGARVREPGLQMVDGRLYPERYSFTFKGAFFLVFGAAAEGGVAEETLAWMRDELAKARVYEARYVVSHLPLHKPTDEHLGTLDKKFRLYELFLRGRVTTLFSAGYRVFYKGRYGALPIVSVGALAGPGGRLAGTDFDQPPSFAVVDQVRGAPERIFAVTGPTFDRALDEAALPATVEVYTK